MDDRFAAYREALKLGHVAAMRGQHRDALRHYQEAAGHAPDRALPHTSMAEVLLRLGRPKDAVAAAERAAELAPDEPQVIARLADTLEAADRPADAERLRGRIAALEQDAARRAAAPIAVPSSMPRADVLHLAGQRARQEGRHAAAVAAWLEEARVHAADGHLTAALDACEQALSSSSTDMVVHLEMAGLYFRLGWHELGVERLLLLDRLLEYEPQAEISNGVSRLAAEHAAVDLRLAALAGRSPADGAPLG
jgi:tetratricopeptide (TPR) repeat protein